jgi:hypothetical protein
VPPLAVAADLSTQTKRYIPIPTLTVLEDSHSVIC